VSVATALTLYVAFGLFAGAAALRRDLRVVRDQEEARVAVSRLPLPVCVLGMWICYAIFLPAWLAYDHGRLAWRNARCVPRWFRMFAHVRDGGRPPARRWSVGGVRAALLRRRDLPWLPLSRWVPPGMVRGFDGALSVSCDECEGVFDHGVMWILSTGRTKTVTFADRSATVPETIYRCDACMERIALDGLHAASGIY
jgi:hypothetical protein